MRWTLKDEKVRSTGFMTIRLTWMELGHVEGKGKKDVVGDKGVKEIRAKFCKALNIRQNSFKFNVLKVSKKGSECQIPCWKR